MISEFRLRRVTQIVKPMASHVAESIARSKKNMKNNENPQMDPNEHVTKTRRKKGRKIKHFSKLVNESKCELEVKAAEKTE